MNRICRGRYSLALVLLFSAAGLGACRSDSTAPAAVDVSGSWVGEVALMDSLALDLVQGDDGRVRGNGTYWILGIAPQPVLVRGTARERSVTLTLLDAADTLAQFAVVGARVRGAERLDGTITILQPYGLGAALSLTAARR